MADHTATDTGHDHTPGVFQKDEKVHGYYHVLGLALKELLIEKDVVTAEEVREAIELRDAISPATGAQVVARSWSDPDFHLRLMADANTAVTEFGINMGSTVLVAVENTPEVHNAIVCTLCSCYPRALLGLPPSWYKSRDYRSRVVREPRAVLAEFGTALADGVEVRVHDSTADMRYLVVPMRPEGTENLSEQELAALVTRDCMIGVAVPNAPQT
ncbi:MAG: nitrile hydratase subunit alpha [Alphaproteobacteria bacterium]